MIKRINTYEETELCWLIPSAIDMVAILQEHPPAFDYNIHHFYYLIDTICDKMDYLNEKDKIKWIHLKSTRLQTFNQEYKRYLQYLTKQGILEYNASYKVGEACKGYRISPKFYSGMPIEIPVTRKEWGIWKKIKMIKGLQKKKCVTKEDDAYSHLSKWLNEKLVIDIEGARKKMDEIYPRIPKLRKYKNKKGKIVWTRRCTRFKAERAVRRLACKDFYYKVDDKIGRFHSNLTGLNKKMRDYITYDGQKLVSLDIKNSQPLKVGILLNPRFYERGEHFNIWSIPSLNNLLNNKLNLFHKSIPSLYSTIMLGQSPESLAYKEFQEYLKMVQAGKYYEELEQLLFPGKTIDRQDMKETAYILMYADNRHGSKERLREKPFKEKFPTIFAVFSQLKRHNKRVLSHILQRLESTIVVEKATRRIALEKPDLPIFTIHDSITTTVGNEAFVETVLKEEIKAVTGLNASIGREYWMEEKEVLKANITPVNKAV